MPVESDHESDGLPPVSLTVMVWRPAVTDRWMVPVALDPSIFAVMVPVPDPVTVIFPVAVQLMVRLALRGFGLAGFGLAGVGAGFGRGFALGARRGFSAWVVRGAGFGRGFGCAGGGWGVRVGSCFALGVGAVGGTRTMTGDGLSVTCVMTVTVGAGVGVTSVADGRCGAARR